MALPTRRTAHTMRRNVTLMDVARAAGVGKSTVSNVLNGSGRVGEAARARVLEMVDQLGPVDAAGLPHAADPARADQPNHDAVHAVAAHRRGPTRC